MRNIFASSRYAVYVLGLCAVLALSACAPAMATPSALAPAQPAMEESASGGMSDGIGRAALPGMPEAQVERIVIKDANLTIAVPDPNQTMSAITEMADEMGGFVVTANVYQTELGNGIQVPRASITIRVPAERLNEALAQIRAYSSQPPLSENINSQDVTSEYTDLQSRLRNLESAEAQLTEIMGSATKTEDVLSVYSQLVSVREQIEVIKGQIKYYEQSAALSSISTEIMADEAVQPLSVAGWQPVGVAKDALEALIRTIQVLGSLVIWLLIFFLPIILVLALIFVLPPFLIWRAWRKRQAGKKQVLPTEKARQE